MGSSPRRPPEVYGDRHVDDASAADAEEMVPMSAPAQTLNPKVVGISIAAAVGGFLFGFDTSVIKIGRAHV